MLCWAFGLLQHSRGLPLLFPPLEGFPWLRRELWWGKPRMRRWASAPWTEMHLIWLKEAFCVHVHTSQNQKTQHGNIDSHLFLLSPYVAWFLPQINKGMHALSKMQLGDLSQCCRMYFRLFDTEKNNTNLYVWNGLLCSSPCIAAVAATRVCVQRHTFVCTMRERFLKNTQSPWSIITCGVSDLL